MANDNLDGQMHRVDHRRRDFSFPKHVFTRLYSLIMMSFTLRQLDHTRQPGSARVAAGWNAPMTGASSSIGVIEITFGELTAKGGRDSRSRNKVDAGTGSEGFTP
jgi:hypothetical protein